MSSVCDPNPSFRSDGFVFLEKIFVCTVKNIYRDTRHNSLDAVGGGDDDGRVAGEERGAAAVPALVVAQHGHVPRQLPGPRLAPCTRVVIMSRVTCQLTSHHVEVGRAGRGHPLPPTVGGIP